MKIMARKDKGGGGGFRANLKRAVDNWDTDQFLKIGDECTPYTVNS